MRKPRDLRIPFSWEERRPCFLERFFYIPGLYDAHDAWVPVDWADEKIFGRKGPVSIEFCSGNGQWIAAKAKERPDLLWVAVEKRFDRARKIWAASFRENLPNLFTVCSEARLFSRFYAPKQSVEEIYINFPDPWPKLRHAKHRLVRAEFLHLAALLAKPGAKATFVSDDLSYVTQMVAEAAQCSVWKSLLPPPHYSVDDRSYGTSYFADLWKRKGRQIHYLFYELL